MIELEDAVAALARYDGDIDASARHLQIPQEALIHLIAQNPDAPKLISQYMRTLTLLHSYQLLDQARNALRDKIDDMTGRDVSTTYISLIDVIAKLTTPTETTTTVNINDHIMRSLPPEARIALKALMDSDLPEEQP
jgi:hypothetical protein